MSALTREQLDLVTRTRKIRGYFELTWNKELAATFTRVADELHRQYWLAFPPSKLDDKVHKLVVNVKRPDLIVRARKTYVASKAGPGRN